MVLVLLLYVLTGLLVCSCVYQRYSRKGRLRAKLPGPASWPIIGNSLDLILPQDELFLYLRSLHKKYGDVIGFGALHIGAVNIYNPKDIETILSSPKFIEKQQPYTFLRRWLGEGLLTSNGKKWQNRRKLLTPAFHFNILKRFFRTFEEETQVFLEKVDAEVGNEQTDIVQLICNMTLRTVCKTAMGTSNNEGIQALSTKYFNAIQKLGACLVQRTCRLWLFIEFTYKFSQDKIYEEMKSIFSDSDRPVSMDDLKRMKYLECCLKESLRLYPSVHYIARTVTEDVQLGGYTVPAGSLIQLHIYDVHHRADLYPEPERFVPERFLPENCVDRHPFAYIPFSAGPRNCIGQKFAMLEMMTLTSSLLRKYRLQPVTRPADLVFISELVLRVKHPVYVKFCLRE